MTQARDHPLQQKEMPFTFFHKKTCCTALAHDCSLVKHIKFFAKLQVDNLIPRLAHNDLTKAWKLFPLYFLAHWVYVAAFSFSYHIAQFRRAPSQNTLNSSSVFSCLKVFWRSCSPIPCDGV